MRHGLLVLLALAAPVAAQQAVTFKDVPLGVSQAEFKKALPAFECRSADRCVLYGSSRDNNLTFGTAKPSFAKAEFVEDKLAWVEVSTEPLLYLALVDAYTERHKQAPTITQSTLTTRANVEVQNSVARWDLPDGSRIVVTRYAGSLDSGRVSLQSPAGIALEAKQAAARLAAIKRDI